MPDMPALHTEPAPAAHLFYVPFRITEVDGRSIDLASSERTGCSRIFIVLGGSGVLRIHDEMCEVDRGSVYLCDAFQKFDLISHTLLKGVLIEYRCLGTEDTETGLLKYPLPLDNCPDKLLRQAGELQTLWREPRLSGPFRVQRLFIDLMEGLYEEVASRQRPGFPWLKQSVCFMQAHFDEDLTRDQMAERANVSPEHFSRAFRKFTGRTFNEYLTLLRIRGAQKRILTGSPDLNTLAQEIGYKEGTYLSRKFKQSVGVSPTVYRGQSKRIAALNPNYTAALTALGITPELGVYTGWTEKIARGSDLPEERKFDPYVCTPSRFYETVAASRPDVIISYDTQEENNSLLPLAPVLDLPFKTMSWREQFRIIADIVNKRGEAEEWLRLYDKRLVPINRQLDRQPGNRGTAAVWEIGTDKAYGFGSSYGRSCQILYDDIGFRPPDRMLEQGLLNRGYVETPIETIGQYAADHIFITALPCDPQGRQRLMRLFRSQEWLELDAVRQRKVYLLNQPELFSGFDPLSSLEQLRVLTGILTPDHKFT
ncbi:ABC transporter substrate-binding protein [Paenibacillus sp. UNC499MF]|uniref:ABC transporter substrate-binding protein n=1 Tax=Paenibacillus sp. UNC499MF TaxID=1502751 RepID=UPI00089FF0E0|nr:ABC transporter substrate-binding protein [Paenibacillus sp. UNC499MF]SEF72140.1 ABC-type Fe3+-hydroxamate transport system, substrate-binding protein [Paenibacillus sp. UNC499MF]